MSDHPPYLFWASEIGPYKNELHQLILEINNCQPDTTVHHLIKRHLQGLPTYQEADLARLRYQAYLLVMQDLLRQGWQYECKQGRIYLSPPSWTKRVTKPEEILAQKAVIRETLNYKRMAQLNKPAVRRFIAQMERERPFDGQMVSIRSLFANGVELAADLTAVADAPTEMEEAEIYQVIQPYLQLITSNQRCQHTGLRLYDIWRYLRLTWSIPYNSTPGRNMFYLVRDAARPFHPVIGIAALGNSLMQITARDQVIGWTSKAMFERIASDKLTEQEAQTIAKMLRNTLQAALNDIATEELVTEEELASPTEATLSKLHNIAEEAQATRVKLLQKRQQKSRYPTPPPHQRPFNLGDQWITPSEVEQLEEEAQKALFRTKRARTLRALLAAQQTLSNTPVDIASRKGLRKLIESAKGQKALKTLVRENKKQKIGINMMELIICGAIPPYTYALGGKLVAMIMTSAEIVCNYEKKYKNSISNIASNMKGEPVVREPKLVFLGTNSLYHSGSSQYNRVHIPLGYNGNKNKLSYIKYGKTEGFGSVQFSQDTMTSLDKLQSHLKKATLINNRFGEGVNPKLRRVRAGLASIGLDNSERFLKHRSKRIVYGVPLGEAAYDFLRGETDDPKYYFDTNSAENAERSTKHIAEHWAKRWLLNRVKKEHIVQQIYEFTLEDYLLSNILRRYIDNNFAHNTTEE